MFLTRQQSLVVLLISLCLLSCAPGSRAAEPYSLVFGIALHDEGQFTPVGQTDGVTFAIQIQSGTETKEVFRKHMPKTARKINFDSVDLSAYAGKVIQIRFIADPGPAGDATYDWGVWVDPRVVQGKLPNAWWQGDNLEKAAGVKVVFSAIDDYANAAVGAGDKEGERAGAIFSPAAFPVGWDVSAMPWPIKVCYGQKVRGIFAQPAWDGEVAASWGEYLVGLGVPVPQMARATKNHAGDSQSAEGAAAQLGEATRLSQTLNELIATGREKGLQMRLPRVTAAVLKIYIPRIQQDLDGITEYSGPNFPGWYEGNPPYGYQHALVKLADKGRSPEFIAKRKERGIKMAAYLVRTAQHAIAEAQEILAHPDQEVKYPEYNISDLKIRNGYFYSGDEPALLTGLYTNIDVTPSYDSLAEIGICFSQPERLNVFTTVIGEGKISPAFVDSYVVRDTLALAQQANIGCVLDLGLAYLPDWAKAKYPDLINPGSAHNEYGIYSVVSDEMKSLTVQYLDQLIPKAAKYPVALGYEMANQAYHNPWSPKVIEMFRAWAKQQYSTINNANARWSSSFKSFDEIQPLENFREMQPLGLRYDWICFQHQLTSDWYRWLNKQIKTRDPRALVEVQLAGNLFQPQKFAGHDCARVGIDEVDLYRNITDITGIDFCTWYWGRFVYEQAGQHCDLLRSLAPDKPLVNFEYSFGTYNTSVSWGADYMQASLWYSYLHGMAGNTMWIWTVSELWDETQQNTLARWPDRMEVLGRTALELRRRAKEIVAFGRQKGQIAILYSAPSRWFDNQKDDEYYQQARQMWHAVSMIDAPFEFISDEQIQKDELNRFKVLLVPACTYTSDETYNKVRAFVRSGGTVLMTARSFSADSYGKPRTLPQTWTIVADTASLLRDQQPSTDGRGSLYVVNPLGVDDYQRLLNAIADRVRVTRPVRVSIGEEMNHSVELRCVPTEQGGYLLYCFNLSTRPADMRLKVMSGYQVDGNDLLKDRPFTMRMTLQPLELCMWRVKGPAR